METTRNTARNLVRNETPARLRLWSALVVLAATALLLATSLVMARVQDQVRIIGREAAPQAATAADLYFALSDMDAQITRLLLTGDSDALAGTRVDAQGSYQERSRQVDADLQRSLTTAAGDAERAVALDLLDGLAVYHQRVGQTITAAAVAGQSATGRPAPAAGQGAAAGQAAAAAGQGAVAAGQGTAAAGQEAAAADQAGKLPPDALGYYTQATNILHLRLLPAAQQLRDAATSRLDQAYADKRASEATGYTLAILFGGALLVLLVVLQVWMARRFRRSWNPALLAATALSLVVVFAAMIVLSSQAGRMSGARDEDLTPYLALSRLRAVGYDAAADTSRYLVSANLTFYKDDFTAKSDCLTSANPVAKGNCGPGIEELAGTEALQRWQAYQRDHEKVVSLADTGRSEGAVEALTGIRRGDAAFDFAYFDAAVGSVTDVRKQGFDRALSGAERTLRGWVIIPIVALGLVILLIPLGVRRRLAEYR
ncbi:hypothetical protein [Actinoplanes sp. L3-i22]|uniref:hypothetical protein n=1 Tax=Actinoplanes sp. L3-i22 TaxID=2836373 RepID=UPI001C846576|nr:hypothetical protein [Actinoplanes sp. L3-i22]